MAAARRAGYTKRVSGIGLRLFVVPWGWNIPMPSGAKAPDHLADAIGTLRLASRAQWLETEAVPYSNPFAKPLLATAMAALATFIFTTTSAIAAAQAGELPNGQSPDGLVRAAVKNEIADSNDTSDRHMFRSRKQTAHGSQTKLYVETEDAMAGMVIAYDDHPLTPQQRQGELDHLDWLVRNPEQLRNKHAREKEDAERTLRMLRAIPDAFLFEYEGTETTPAGIGKAGDSLLRLKFRPNPNYSPPSRVEQALAGMQGYVLIDADQLRISKIDGTLVKEVSFGWGILGHLDPGGHFLVEQTELPDGAWEITRMILSFTGKILLFKSLNYKSDEVFSDFRRVPADTRFAQGVEMLKAEEAKLAAANSAPDSKH